MNFNSSSKLDRVMTPEQFTQVVEAILAGKYSWACVLILRFAGYNPLHYIPYRTYNRLMKENCPGGRWDGQRNRESVPKESIESAPAQTLIHEQEFDYSIDDLDYLDLAGARSQTDIKGGHTSQSSFSLNNFFRSFRS